MPAFLTRPRRLLPRGLLDLLVQFAIVFVIYETYRLTRGLIDDPLSARVAFRNAEWIIDAERALRIDVEDEVQRFAESVGGLSSVSSFLYINVQTTVTFAVMAYIYVRFTSSFGFVRNAFVATWAIALVGFVLLPTAPPRLIPELGLRDSVSIFTGVDPSDRQLQRFYNPYAAMPSLHCGIATLVGGSLALLSRTRAARIAWSLYPVMVIFVVMATGNHYLLDAVAGVLVALAGAGVAWGCGRLRPDAWALHRGPGATATATAGPGPERPAGPPA
ncbi:unannotated protein [freshwater metagenome]|uniref:Unannotated protein n=1 Tax=freshwater metagenome TaxID=449393 RepID=A0A6J7FJ39_9ZZZZ|nr:phosphatase PAP2 family protein [Actinomycetota bacterium]